MKNLLLIMCASSILVFISSANAFECPGVVRVPQTGNIVNLSEVDMDTQGYGINFPASVNCVYNYISTSENYYGQRKTFTFNYTDYSYNPINLNNWDITPNNNAKCYSSNPADCAFWNYTSMPIVKQLQRCPDTLTDPGGGVHHFELGQNNSSGQFGTTRCTYNFYQNDGGDTQVYEGLYFDSYDNYKQSLWYSPGNGLVCVGKNPSGYEGNEFFVNPNRCEFYLAN